MVCHHVSYQATRTDTPHPPTYPQAIHSLPSIYPQVTRVIHSMHYSYPQARPTEIDRVIHRATPAHSKAGLWGQSGRAEAERPDTRLYQILKLDVYLMACTMVCLGLPFLTWVNLNHN